MQNKVRKHKGIHQSGNNAGKLMKGYRYSGNRLKNGLAEIVRSGKVQRGGNTPMLNNENNNIIKARYPNNVIVFFIGTFHGVHLMSEENISTIANALQNNPNVELWVENRDTLNCNELARSFFDAEEIIEEHLTQEIIKKIPDLRRGNCSRPNILRGWDTRHHQLRFVNNQTGKIFDAQKMLYNAPLHEYLTLWDLNTYMIDRMPYGNVKQDLIQKFNMLKVGLDINVIIKNTFPWPDQKHRLLGDIVETLRKQFAIWSDENVHKELLKQNNKTIFVIQGFHHYVHFRDIFLKNIQHEIGNKYYI